MKNKFAIAVLTALLLPTSHVLSQQWSWVSGSSGNIKPSATAANVIIDGTKKLLVDNDITSNWGTVKGYNLQADNIILANGDITSNAGTVKGYNILGTNAVYSFGYMESNGEIRANNGDIKTLNATFEGMNLKINNIATIANKLTIGTVPSTPSGYKLYVKDGILTEKIKVALSTDAVNWSDFVFADDYQLRPLNEVESFVKKNKHLPEIPSAKEVYANGLDLAQMDAKLLQKIEELTLYVIEQQKEINSLKSKLNK